MKFEEYPLVVPSLEELSKEYEKLIAKLENAKNADEQINTFRQVIKFDDHVETMFTIISIRYSLDTTNETYAHAQDVMDEVAPQLQVYSEKINKIMLNSPYRKELEDAFGTYLFKQLELALKCFDAKIIEDLQKENKLVSKYDKVMAGAKIKFNGQTYNLSQMGKFTTDVDRNVRKKATKAVAKFFEKNHEEIGQIYDDLVHVRDNMAKKLGFKNFIELGYARLGRLDYNDKDVANYRKQIQEVFVPIWVKLFKRQMKRIKIRSPRFYDLGLNYLTGNPRPIGDAHFLVEQARTMYKEMSKETGEFFDFMTENHLMDLEARPGKQGGGYMTYLAEYKSPFIFSNFNGTSGDVDVLTHEFGHAYQGYCSRNIKVPSYRSPTLEACEIHSMSMEFFAWPWMDKFFGENADKYRYAHLADAMMFLPYGVTVDEFQHFVYEHPNATHTERCAKWREIEKKYTPLKNYKGFDVYEEGNLWLRQSHIFQTPFYYIDYTLAQVVAFQFLVEMHKNQPRAWAKYNRLCKMGGKYPFTELLSHAHLRNPFEDGSLKKIARPLNKILRSFDDQNM
ncbi:MAG: M3 family oligoendopeptidase [Erysipelotrichaceae bacterium]|nr:M3 family oligoendopeptidase [Erysipelotrichaceae bacterium]